MKHWLLSLFCLGLLFGQNPETAVFPGAVVTDETLLVAKDSAWSTLNGDINDSTLTVEVWDGGRFAYPSVVKIDNEFLKVCSIATSTMTICSGGRGFAGTTPASHGSGALVEDVVTAKHHNLPMAEIKAIQTALGAGFAKSGDTSTVVTTTGAQTSGRCVEIDANGNHIQAAAECGGGGGASASRDLTDLKVAVGSGTQLDFAAGAFGDHDESFTLAAGYFTIQSRSVSSISAANPATITTSTALGVGFHNGDSVNVAGVAGTGCSTLNALHVITVTGASTFTVPINTTGLTCTGGTVAGTGNGTAYVYGRDDGEILVEVPASSGVIATCGSGSCVVNQVTTPSHALGIAPLATVTIAAGAWETATDVRAFLGKRPLVAGTGIEVLGDLVSIDPATVPQLGGTNAWTGTNDLSAASRTASFKSGTTAPATCTVGDTFFDTDAAAGSNFFGCTSTNTWTAQGASTFNSFDEDVVYLRDDFYRAFSTNPIGELGWTTSNVQGSNSFATVNDEANHVGIYQVTTAAADNDGGSIRLKVAERRHDLDTAWEYRFIIRIPTTVTTMLGWAGVAADNGIPRYNSIGVRYDTDASDATWKCMASSAYTATTADTEVKVAADTWYTVRIYSTVAGTAWCSVNGSTPVSVNSNFPEVDVQPLVGVLTREASATRAIQVDFFAYKQVVAR